MKPSDLYLTPPDLVAEICTGLRAERIGFDPCGHVLSRVGAHTQFLLELGEDALTTPWPRKDTCFMNPPFSQGRLFLGRFLEQFRAGAFVRGAILCLTAPGSAYWSRYVWGEAAYVTFLQQRVRFLDDVGEPMRNSFDRECAIVWYGADHDLDGCARYRLGHTVRADV